MSGSLGPPGSGEGGPSTTTRPQGNRATETHAKAPISSMVADHAASAQDVDSPMLRAALEAHRQGFDVVQLHGLRADGKTCTCSKGRECRSAAKHPTDLAWTEAPRMTEDEIRKAWSGWRRDHNYGIRTGKRSGTWILDVDPEHGGDESLARLQAERGLLSRTRQVKTGSGGSHFYFTVPADFDVTNAKGALKDFPGLDVRGTGGQVVGPGSVTDKGSYDVVEDAPIAAAPDWLLEMLRPKERRQDAPGPSAGSGEHAPYFTAAVAGELARFDAMQAAATPGGVGYRGENWDDTCHEVACTLQEIANTPGSGVSLDYVREQYLARAPHDDGFGPRDHHKCWESAAKEVAGKTRSAPVNLAAEVDTWDIPGDSKPGGNDERVKPPAEGALTDARMSAEVAAHLQARFRWSPGLGWLRYDGKRWVDVDDSAVLEAVRRYVVNLHARQARQGKSGSDLAPFAALLGATRIANLTKLAKGQLLVEAADLDARPDLLNVGNGVVDLRTGTLGPHDPDLLLTKITTTPYLPDATHADWDAALTALPDADTREWMQDKLGQGVTGHMASDDMLVVAEGAGSNGKSAVVNAVLSAAGEHAVVVGDRVLLSNPSDHPTELMTLRGARIAIIEEAPEGRRLNVKRLKDVVGTTQIAARLIRRDSVTFPATHSLFLTTNYSLDIAETDHGTWRRLARVRFPLTFRSEGQPLDGPDDRRGDPLLRERLKAGQDGQREAVLRWLVDGARRWYAAGQILPPPPKQVQLDTLAWRGEADLVLSFFREHLAADPTSHISSADLCAAFREWLQRTGHPAWTDRTITSRFGSHDVVTSAGIKADRGRPGPGHSRPAFVFAKPPGDRFRAWTGVRFLRPDEGDRDDV